VSTQTVLLVDYGAGNLKSAENALLEAARRADTAVTVHVSAEPDDVRAADRIVLPGVGAFASCRAGLDAAPGLVEALDESVRVRGAPFLGICVGLQLLADAGLEHGRTPGLGWLPGEVRPLELDDPEAKLPHMGWNTVQRMASHPVTDAVPDGAHVYFVHSFALNLAEPSDELLASNHGGRRFTAAAGRDNVLGVQFHPEKSQDVGLALLARFLEWRP